MFLEGKVFFNDDIKDYLAKEFKHFNSQIVDLDEKLLISNEKHNFKGEDLRRSCFVNLNVLMYVTSFSPRSGLGNPFRPILMSPFPLYSSMAGCRITPVLGFWEKRELNWVKFTSETGFELPSSCINLPCYALNLNRNILDFMK